MRTTLLLIGLLVSPLLLAQNNSTIGFSMHGFLPTGELKQDASEIWGGGFGTEVAFQIKESPIYLGGTFSFTRYGSKVRKGYHNIDFQDVRYRYHNEMMQLAPLIRFKPETYTRFMPYADFTFGTNLIYTRARVFDREIDEVVDNFFEIEDFVLSYGLGAGLEYLINESISLNLFVRRNFSSRGEYLTPDTIQYDEEIEGYQLDIQQSRFSSLVFGIGLNIILREF
ncbi:hypothetical protein [Roseivirga sp.]|uniref:hypothetical protein n=1 Tax=Roseivirga sp. TaxID=1964215 RepID=UPI003B8B9101